jgi:hypothetical protein
LGKPSACFFYEKLLRGVQGGGFLEKSPLVAEGVRSGSSSGSIYRECIFQLNIMEVVLRDRQVSFQSARAVGEFSLKWCPVGKGYTAANFNLLVLKLYKKHNKRLKKLKRIFSLFYGFDIFPDQSTEEIIPGGCPRIEDLQIFNRL